MGWAPSYNPFLLIGVAIPGVILYGLYLYALHRLLLKTGLSQKLLLAAVLIDLAVSGPQRTLMWPVFGPHFLVGIFYPPIPLSALVMVLVLSFAKWNIPHISSRNSGSSDR